MDRRDFLKLIISATILTGTGLSTKKDTKEAYFYEKLENKKVRCTNCPHECVLRPGEIGFCRARKNIDGKLYSLAYGNPCAVHIDPIEKKPLFHFLPGTTAFSIATAGCNFRCKFCQNYQISQKSPDETVNQELSPEDIVQNVLYYRRKYNISSIAYTYTEPGIFYEYMLDTSEKAKKYGIKNIYHSNGYLNEKPLLRLTKYLDGANIDLKFFNEKTYQDLSMGHLEPVLETLKTLHREGVHLEITNLVIPQVNDNFDEIKRMVKWIKSNLGRDIPIHFSRFFPTYKLTNLPPTPVSTVERARALALNLGMHYVYIGNVPAGHPGENTYCPKCKRTLIRRLGFMVVENNLVDGKCPYCGTPIKGVWG
ncbi:AmmeMemoRadiSam system radical SAM enzyme [bacterium]|nr:MAG: AmmeMemoRadiSam system radical SAM enzyme [bacterium]